jgi:tRNA-modifying protein YgfZ
MNSNWKDFLAKQGAQDNFEHFGDPAGELAASRSATIVAPLADQGVIRATGEEAAGFLHNLLTNDINHIPADGARHAGMCTAKGRLIASFLIWREGGDYLLQLSADILPAIHKKLSMYVLRSKVKLLDASDERVLIGIAGPQAEALVGGLGAKLGATMSSVAFDGGVAVRLDAQRFVLAVAAASADAVWNKLVVAAKPAGLAAWRLAEIAAGQPRVVAATQEAFVPQMINYELPAVGGVSFQKGCYPGQEIVARTQYLGKVKRRMYRARLDAAFPPGTDVFTPEAGNQHCGALVSVAPAPEGGYECLLVVQSSGMEAGEVHVGSPDGPKAAFLPLPYAIE